MRIPRFLKNLISSDRPEWPEGEPLVSGGIRWGTRLPDGSIIGGPGVTFTPLPVVCPLCQSKLDEAGDAK